MAWALLLLVAGCRTAAPGPFAAEDPGLEFARAPEGVRGQFATAEQHRLQILVSEVVADGAGAGRLRRHGFRVGAEYFYPASSIKLCAAVAALQVIEELQGKRGTRDLLDVPLEIAPLFPGDVAQRWDAPAAAGGPPRPITVGREIRRLGLVSDNRAFNRLFEIVGHEDLNRRMHQLGLCSAVLNHRLSETRAIPDPQATARVTWRETGPGSLLVELPARGSDWRLANGGTGLRVGTAYLAGERRVEEPMDFAIRNGMSLVDLQNLLVKLARPEIELGTPPLLLSEAHRTALLAAMTEYPRESADPVYAAQTYPDEYSKFLLPGVRRVFPSRDPKERIVIAGKIGRAYGFSVENAYLRNPRNGRAVFVSAVIYTNEDGVLNDDRYEYGTVADPFFADLGEWVARRWLSGE